jgi:hypothetical protein
LRGGWPVNHGSSAAQPWAFLSANNLVDKILQTSNNKIHGEVIFSHFDFLTILPIRLLFNPFLPTVFIGALSTYLTLTCSRLLQLASLSAGVLGDRFNLWWTYRDYWGKFPTLSGGSNPCMPLPECWVFTERVSWKEGFRCILRGD